MELRIEQYAVPEVIGFNYDELKEELQEKLRQYETVVYTEDQIRIAKADRAALVKLIKALNDERIKHEKAYMQPFKVFRERVDEIIKMIEKPVKLIDEQLSEYEEKRKEEKKSEITKLFASLNPFSWLELSQIFDKRWLNATFKLADVKDAMQERFERISSDLMAIDAQYGSVYARALYFECLDLSRTLAEAKRHADLMNKEHAASPERASEPIKAEADKKVDGDQESGEKGDSVKMWVAFRCLLDMEQAVELKEFFDSHKITFERMEG